MKRPKHGMTCLETSPDENGSQRYHSIILVLMFFCRTNADFDARRFPKIANLNDPETQTRRIKFATGSLSFETNYISSGMNSVKGCRITSKKSKQFSVQPLNLLDWKTPSDRVKIEENCEMSNGLKMFEMNLCLGTSFSATKQNVQLYRNSRSRNAQK